MKVREEDRNMVLLASVAVVCAMLALIAGAFEPAASTARTDNKQVAAADQASQASVRVVGVPFVPNTNPREHQ